MQASSGASGAAAATYVDDVFSTYLYDGNGSSQFVNNGIDLGAYPFAKVASTDGNSVSGSETFTVNVKADTKLVVFILNSNNVLPTCTVDGSSLTAATSSSNSGGGYHDSAVFIETLTAGFHTIVTSDTALGHTEVMLFDPNATVSVHTNLGVTTSSATSVTTSSVTTDGFCVFLGSDRDPGANFSCNQTSTEYYEVTHTYFNFGAIAINGSSGTVPASVISGMVGTYPTNWCLLKVEGVGNDPTANSAATGKGGLVWIKQRNSNNNHLLIDTVRGATKTIFSNSTFQEVTYSNGLMSFNNNGFTLGTETSHNSSGIDYVSWAFRKQPGFFDVVTWSGDGTVGRQISHNLESTPGFVAIKRTDSADNWKCWHTSTGDGVTLELDGTAADTGENWPTGGFTSTYFTVNSGGSFNAIGGTYVAYLFAHDAQNFGTNSNESIIYCGTYEGDGTAVNEITLGWEPQWILIKDIDDASGNWILFDIMRGAVVGGDSVFLEANSSDADNVGTNPTKWYPTPTGFVVDAGAGGANDTNDNGETYIYVAIRRPHKPASEFAATDLFSVSTRSGNGTDPYAITGAGFTVDTALIKRRNDVQHWPLGSRLTGDVIIHTSDAQGSLSNKISNSGAWDVQDGLNVTADAEVNASGGTYVDFLFKRAPGFFDVVAYSGNGVYPRAITHNLGVAPEIVIVKRRTGAGHWLSLWTSLGAGNRMRFDTAASASTIIWNSTLPTSTEFTVNNNDVNSGSEAYVAYLFASSPGISKVGSYTGTGSDIDVDCGFTSGARFVLLKRTDDAASWYVFDTSRGIVAGNDPMINLDTTAVEVTNTDYIDPISSGFRIPSTATSALNASGGNYIFLAIA